MMALEKESEIVISAGTLAELLIVSMRQESVRLAVADLIDRFGFNIEPVTRLSAERIGQAYERWGRGFHPAALNFGDCFAYDVAKQYGCALLYTGNDFSRTDVDSVF